MMDCPNTVHFKPVCSKRGRSSNLGDAEEGEEDAEISGLYRQQRRRYGGAATKWSSSDTSSAEDAERDHVAGASNGMRMSTRVVAHPLVAPGTHAAGSGIDHVNIGGNGHAAAIAAIETAAASAPSPLRTDSKESASVASSRGALSSSDS